MTKMLKGAGRGASRRQVLLGAAGTAAVGLGFPSLGRAQNKPPVRIGLLNTFSKTFAFGGESNVNGTRLYFDQNNWEVAGRKIELIKEDDEANPQVALQKIKKLVELDKVDFVCGPQVSNVAMAILGYVKQTNTFLVINGAGAAILSQERYPNLFRSAISNPQLCFPMADWVYDNLAKEIFLTGSDFAGGREVVLQFKTQFVKRGGKVLKEVFPPLGTNDFSAYLADIKAASPPATFSMYAGSDAVRFVKQYSEFGLKEKIPLTGYGSVVDADTIPGQGDSAIGAITVSIYADSLDNPENKAFVAAYRAKHKDYPNLYSDYGYVTARVIAETLKLTGGDTSDKGKLSKAMETMKFNAPRGPFRFHPETHQPIQNVYIVKAGKVGDRIANTVVKTIPDVAG